MYRVFQHHASAAAFMDALMDGLVGFVAVLLAAVTLQWGAAVAPGTLIVACGFALSTALLHSFVGLYRHANLGALSVGLRMGGAALVGGYLTYLVVKQFDLQGHPGPLLGYAACYLVVGVLVLRGSTWAVRRSFGVRRVLIIGTGEEAMEVAKGLARNERTLYEVAGFLPTSTSEEAPAGKVRVFDRGETVDELVRKHRIDEIIVAAREQRGGVMPMDQLLACRTRGIPILDLAAFYERTHAEVPLSSLKASWLIYGNGFVQGRARRAAKRAFDIVTSGLLLVLASPIMLITMIAIKIDSKGPVIYKQERVGEAGGLFVCLKFRSMRTDAEKDGVARWASRNDSRVTRVGRFIRKTRIDELPQLLSVLRGEMSMVGPRPERLSFVEQLRGEIPFYDLRHSIKPGVTGWAQVRYAYGASIEDARRKHQFDLYYLKNNSLWLDVLILIETVTVVLFREGAQ